jgi:aspartyl/asparaginyl-tRNA synthetase
LTALEDILAAERIHCPAAAGRERTMITAEVANVGKFNGQEILIKGWIYNIRSSGKILFILVRDGTGTIQCVVEKSSAGADLFDKASGLQQESSLEIRGTVSEDSRAPGGYELRVTGLDGISGSVHRASTRSSRSGRA